MGRAMDHVDDPLSIHRKVLPSVSGEAIGEPVRRGIGGISAELEGIDLVVRILHREVDVRLGVAEYGAGAKIWTERVLDPYAAAGRLIVVARQQRLRLA